MRRRHSAPTTRKADAKELAHKAYAVLEKNCHKCHHGKAQKGNSKYDVLDWSSVTAAAPSAKVLAKQDYTGATKYIDSAKPEKSLILLRIRDKSMPPGGKGLAPEDKSAIQGWVESGAGKEEFK